MNLTLGIKTADQKPAKTNFHQLKHLMRRGNAAVTLSGPDLYVDKMISTNFGMLGLQFRDPDLSFE